MENIQKACDGAFLIIQYGNKYCLYRRKDSGLFNLVGGGVETGETPITAMIREVNEEIGPTLFHLDFTLVLNLVQRIPPIKDKLYGNCFIYAPLNPLEFLKRGRDEASFLSSFTLCQTETTEAKLFSLEEAIESDEVTRATKRQLIYYHSYVVENTGRVIESTLGSGVLYKGKTY